MSKITYLDVEHGGSDNLGLLEHVSTPAVQHAVDASNGVLRALKRYEKL